MRQVIGLVFASLGLLVGSVALLPAIHVEAQAATPVASPAAGCPTTTVDQNEDLARRWFAVWSTGDISAVDAMVTADYVHHWGQGPDTHGAAAFEARVTEFRTAFPDLTMHVDLIFGQGDMVAVTWTAHGTHQGSFRGIAPTGKSVTWTGINVFRVQCGRFAETWNETDDWGLLQQLGAVPALGTPTAATPAP